MSGTYPITQSFNAVGFTSVFYNLSSTSLSGRTQVRNIAPIAAFIMAQRGMAEEFTIVLPEISSKSGNATGTVRTNAAESIGQTSISIDGLSGTLKAGDMIKFATHNKVYMIVSDRAGNGQLTIQPSLISAVPNDTIITYDDVPFTVRLNNDVQAYDLGLASMVDYEVDFIEAI